jgi:2'-hydroxyisoflavone reductase
MRILIMGGTAFVGRHIAQAALGAGHDVTLFHRGQTGRGLFRPPRSSATATTGRAGPAQRGSNATAPGGTPPSTSARTCPARCARWLALGGRGGQQLFVSTCSVYKTPVAPGFSEDAPLNELPEPESAEFSLENYGALKVACERLAGDLYGPSTAVIRPTYVVGPCDRSYRFTWWVTRLARGGRVLAPGDPADPIQVIDARDQATFAVSLLERKQAGTYHTVSPTPPFGFGDMLEAIAARVAPPGTELVWVGKDFLLGQGLDDGALPLWPGGDPESDINRADPAAANDAGLAPRPLSQTIDELQAAEAAAPTPVPEGTGLTAEREAGLLATWAAQAG